MRKHSKGLGDRLLLMPPSSTQSSPFSPLGSLGPFPQVTRKKGARLRRRLVVVVVWLYYSKIIFDKRADLSEFVFVDSRR